MPAGVRPNPGPQVSPGPYVGRISPLVQQLSNERGYANVYGGFLPRPASQFTEGAFSPFAPIMPVPIDAPPEGYERPQPRRFSYRTGYNLPVGEPGDEGYKLASFATLKTMSKSYSIARRCIQFRKNEILGLDWDITLTSSAEKAYQGDRAAMRDFGERRAEAKRFFRKPDPDYFSFTSWLSAMLEQVFSIDALSLYLCPKKGTSMGKGLLGSDLDGMWLIDGATVRPLLSLHGGMPLPPAPAYQQYEQGVPRADFTTVLNGLDLPELAGSEARPYRGDQLMYLPMVPFADSPYGFGPTEQAILPIFTGLTKQGYQLQYWTEGTVPAVYISPGDNSMTPNQCRELMDALNAVAGDQAFHWKVVVLPPGSKTMPMKQGEVVDQSDEWIANEVCMQYGVSPMDLGILPKVSTVASPFAVKEMAQASRTTNDRTDTRTLLKFLADIPNFIIQVVCGQDDMEFSFEGQRELQDEAAMTDMLVKQAQIGVRSVDEFRDKLNLPPWGLPETSGPVVFTPMGPVPFSDAVSIATAGQQAKALPPGSGGKKPAAGKPPRAALPGGSVPARQRQRGGAALTPAHAADEAGQGHLRERQTSGRSPVTGPAHPQASVKGALAELEALTRHVARGRDIGTWEARHLPGRALSMLAEQIARGMTPAAAADMVKTIVLPPASYQWLEKARHDREREQETREQAQVRALEQQYAARIRAALAGACAAVARLIAQWAKGLLAVTAAVLATLIADIIRKALARVLRSLWKAAWRLGETDAGGRDKAALEAFLATWGRQVEEWVKETGTGDIAARLRELAELGRRALIAELEQILGLATRPEMIAVTEITRALNAAVLAVMRLLGIGQKRWQTRNDGLVCATCMANQDAGPVAASAPFPSGALSTPQHQNCRCRIIPVLPPKPPAAVKRRRRRDVNLDGEVVVSDASPEDENPAGGGGRTLYPHRADGTQVPGGVPGSTAGGEPPRWDASIPERRGYVNGYGGDDAQWPDRGLGVPEGPDGDFPDGGDEDAEKWPAGGHGTRQAGTSSPGSGPRGRPPGAMGKTAMPKGALADLLAAAPKAKAKAVRAQLGENFPGDSTAWVPAAKWHGPMDVPLELTDFRADHTWAAHHQQDKVDHFAGEFRAGRKVSPVVAVALPDHRHVRIIDGHHRAMACKKLGRPVPMWIGHVTGKATRDAAYETHVHQVHQGDSPANKAASGYDLSPRSGMISLDVPDGLIPVVPGGIDDHHITVVYLGKDVDDETLASACDRAAAAASAAPGPLAGMLAGIGSFPPSAGSDGKVPAFIPARVPGSERLRAALEDLSASEHKDWSPHVTRAYLEPGDPLPEGLAPTAVTFTHLSVHRGSDVHRFPLGG